MDRTVYYNTVILWDHRRTCDPSLTETSLCGAWLYREFYIKIGEYHIRADIIRHFTTYA